MNILKQIYPRRCANGACPGILVTDSDVILIQGAKVATETRNGLRIPGHEDLVSIPKMVFKELLSRYSQVTKD